MREMLNLEPNKCYEITFGNYVPAEKVKIVGEKTVHSAYLHSYPTIHPSNNGWKKGWANYFIYRWDKGLTKNCYFSDYTIVSARELVGSELEEFERLIALGEKNK